jgi:hypothetical protein
MRRVRTCSTPGDALIGCGFALGFFATILDQFRREVVTGCEVAEYAARRSCDVRSCAHLEHLAVFVEVDRQKIPPRYAH